MVGRQGHTGTRATGCLTPAAANVAATVRCRGVDTDVADITEWIDGHVGGMVLAVRRQPRWRPVWLVDVERDGERIELLVRGVRVDFPGVWPLDHEMRFQQLLERHGIPVPRVWGWCDTPTSFVTDRVPGENDFSQSTDEERVAAMRDYMGILARIHGLDPDEFSAAGIDRAADASGSGRVGLDAYVRGYRARKVQPDPYMEFSLRWIDRHPVDSHGREAPVVWDSGQFHTLDGRITAVLDLELGHVGDPMMDLAGFRMRDTVIGYGDMPTLYSWYEAAGGVAVDLDAVMHHHFVFTLTNELAFQAALAAPTPGSDYMTNMQWVSETNLHGLEALAEIHGWDLPTVETPAPRVSPVAHAHAHLVQSLRTLDVDDEFARHQVRIAFRLARHLQRFDEIGDEVTEANLDDLVSLLGRRPATWHDGDAALEEFVLADDGRHDEALFQLFYRRFLRFKMLCGPAGSAMTTHHRCQPLVGRAS